MQNYRVIKTVTRRFEATISAMSVEDACDLANYAEDTAWKEKMGAHEEVLSSYDRIKESIEQFAMEQIRIAAGPQPVEYAAVPEKREVSVAPIPSYEDRPRKRREVMGPPADYEGRE